MTIVRNWPLLIKTALHIKHDPESWDQSAWANRCGTAFCFAGHAIILAGHRFVRSSGGRCLEYVHADGLPDVAMWKDDMHGWLTDARDAAVHLLGIEDSYYPEDLFDSGNTFPEILSQLNRWAREDGVDLPEELHLTDEQIQTIREASVDALDELEKQMLWPEVQSA